MKEPSVLTEQEAWWIIHHVASYLLSELS